MSFAIRLGKTVLLCLAAGTAAAQSPVYVDFAYPGVETGTSMQPYDTLVEGVAGASPGGEVRVLANSSHEVPRITKSVRLVAQGGAVRVGVLSSSLGSGAPLEWLRIVELMYNPMSGGAEFLEVQNTGPASLTISGVQFSLGITFAFPAPTVLAPGQIVVLVRDTDATAFSTLYPGVAIGGLYTGSLDNGGETLQLSTGSGVAFLSLTYNDAGGWPAAADGAGFSLVIRNPQADGNDPANWRGSAEAGGSPGSGETDPNNPLVVINEALTHTDPPLFDSVELRNLTNAPADLRGWFLTDDKNVPQKARIPSTAEFVIPAGGYAVLDEADFAPPPSGSPGSVGGSPLPGFRMSSFGEGIYLFSADVNGALTGYLHGFAFGAAQNGVSFGRVVTSDNREHFVPQTARSFGSANPGASVGALAISEIHYSPVAGGIEYVEITNRSAGTVSLFDTSAGGNPANTFRIGGIGFAFPPGQTLAAGAKALIVNAPPVHYTAQFGAQGMNVYGPFGNYEGVDSFGLSNSDETLRILWPDQEDFNPDLGVNEVPYIAMDTVRYDSAAPWPSASANFTALRRTTLGSFGGEPANWTAQSTAHQATGGVAAAVAFSLPRGFYTGTQPLTMTTSTPSAAIWYTIDGSLPAPGFGTSAQYTGPISMPTTRVLRAAAYRAGWIRSPITSGSYLINTPTNQRGVKALSIIADPQEDLFLPRGVMAINGGTYVSPFGGEILEWVPDLPNTSQAAEDDPFESGYQPWIDGRGTTVYPPGGAPDPAAYNNALKSGRAYERPSSFEWIDPANVTPAQQTGAGLRVHGSNYHRPRYFMNPAADWTLPAETFNPTIFSASYHKFSFRLYFRGDYGVPELMWNVFPVPGDAAPSYDAIVLRGGHNDGINPFVRDELSRRLFLDMGRVSARGAIYNVFLNGVYRGYYNATERYDTDFLASRFGGSKNWDLIVQSDDTETDAFNVEVQEGDRAAWDALMAAVGQNLAVTANYNAVAAILDIEQFIDYLLIELYCGNADWPANNFSAAKERVPGSKWQFLLWDTEIAYIPSFINLTGIYDFPFYASGGLTAGDSPLPVIYRALAANASFRSAFQARALLHLGPGGALDSANVLNRHAALRAEMQAILPAGAVYDNSIATQWAPQREAILISDLRAEGLYP